VSLCRKVAFQVYTARRVQAWSSEITTTVPSGATTGKVEVTTAHGTLTSNVNFQVK
jgi:hypothetical protein